MGVMKLKKRNHLKHRRRSDIKQEIEEPPEGNKLS